MENCTFKLTLFTSSFFQEVSVYMKMWLQDRNERSGKANIANSIGYPLPAFKIEK